ncbi:transporter substrate-binding domain-containing protein [uncultured Roseobacter sp.]|uniref:ATP-binding protein n=1 Tax=uncultured Roseobacter sp. TaxID=114847 RepID=UPI0026261DCC|nr:transporter substrate-binding domain-containing protein [uncultured Roseobacter sp.]
MAYTEFYPHAFTDVNGQPQGLAIDVARRLVGATGRELEFLPTADPGVMMDMIVSGEADMTATLGLTQDRLAIARATRPFGSFRTVLFARKDGTRRTLEDFHGSRIGVVTGSLTVRFAAGIPSAEVVEYPSADARVMALLTGDIDATIATADSFAKRLRQIGSDIFVEPIEPPLGQTPYGFFVSSASGDLLDSLNAQIEAQLTPEVLDQIRTSWFGQPTRLPEHDYILWGSIAGLIVLTIAIGALFSSRRNRRRATSLLTENAENRLLVDALDGVDSAIAIFDKEMHAVHWNKGFVRAMPKMVDALSKGAHLRSLIAASYTNGTIDQGMSAAEAEDFADSIVQRLADGEAQNRIVYAGDGRIFDATDFAIGEDHFASVRVDVTKLYKQAEIIQTQKSELEAANERLALFATIAAHDLKAPLVQQALLMDFIEEDIAGLGYELPEEIREHFNMLTNLSGKMKRLIQDLLDHSRSAVPPEQFEDVDLNARLPDILDMVGLPGGFRVELETQTPIVRVDPVAFDTVVRNLVSNAVKHHDRDEGVIMIRGKEADGVAVFEFEDDGPGIPEQYQRSIFEPFKRLSSKVEGTGLGLSFIHRTALEWGGSVQVHCPAERGSIFTLLIPTVAVARPLAAE